VVELTEVENVEIRRVASGSCHFVRSWLNRTEL
jgi:hypothetical protein